MKKKNRTEIGIKIENPIRKLEEAAKFTNLENPQTITHLTGASRNRLDEVRFTSICPAAQRALSKIHAEGDNKYGNFNWTKGMPLYELLNHCENHLNLWKLGDRSEDHLAKVMWGMAAIIHFRDGCVHGEVLQDDFCIGAGKSDE